MIRFFLRFVGLLLLALAFIFVVYDGIRSISDGSLLFTKASYVWSVLNDGSLQSFRTTVEQYTSRDTWQLAVVPVLEQPAAVIFGVLGILLTLLGRKKKPLIGYARD
jgi:cobalamin biosynthesis protein CobD/CbiB